MQKQDLENSQVAELLREQNSLLRTIKKQGDPLTIAEIKERSPKDYERAKQIRVSMSSLEEVIETDAEAHGFENVTEYLQWAIRPDRQDNLNTKTLLETIKKGA